MVTTNVADRNTSQPRRLQTMDALRAILVAWVIAGHVLLGYSTIGGWTYHRFAEVRFAPEVEWVLAALLGPTALFLMGTFFLIAGMFTSPSLARRGPREFLSRRLLRLGLPFAVTVLLIWPVTLWFAYRVVGRPQTYVSLLTGHRLLGQARCGSSACC